VGGDQLHIGGERAAAFRGLVGDLDPRRVLLVGVDVAKASWFVLGCDLHGNVVIDGTKVAADRAGLGQLAGLLDQARARVCDLLVRGEGSRFLLGDDPATALRPLWSGRKASWTPGPASGCRSSPWSTACGRA